MMNTNIVNLAAFTGKLAIESMSLDPIYREGLKFGIDMVADMVKESQNNVKNIFSVMGYSLEQIYQVKIAAEKHGLEQIVLFPCRINGVFIPCFKMDGGDIVGFGKELEIPLLQDENVIPSEPEIAALIERYGVILYQH